jgi:eukaryotic-like serine/threonine-protein kinase
MGDPTLVDATPPGTVRSRTEDLLLPELPPSTVPEGSGPLPPSRKELGRYRILGLLGSGGMGNVYRALDTELDDIVALKMLRRELSDIAEVRDQFRREVKLARRITHKNVARVFDIGEADGETFLTMELIEGEPLAAVIARRHALPVAEVLDLGVTLCGGLAAAHAAGVVHLDLKPGNVLIERGGRVVITDFGIARALAEAAVTGVAGAGLGTPGYMAPEQVEGRAGVDARADLYALGVVLYELCTGKQPWAGESVYAIASARLRSPPPDICALRPEVPAALGALVARAMALRPEDRPASAADLSSELSALAPHAPGLSHTPAEGAVHRARAGTKTVAVLPFRNAGSAEDDYLAEELTDDLIDTLSMTPGLRVTARGVVARYRGAEVDPREVGRALGVQVVVEGSVRRARQTRNVRVAARVGSVEDGFQLWAKHFDRPAEELLAVNDEVARAVAGALTVDLAPARTAAPAAAAVDLYVRARNKYRRFWPEPVREAIALFEEALALSPGDPALLGGVALARARLSYFERSQLPAAIAAGERAVAAGGAHGEPHLALGLTMLNAGRAPEAVRAMRAVVRLSPGLSEAHAALGRMLLEAGDLEEGTRRLEAAIELDPEAPLALGSLLRVHAFAGEWDRALDLCDRSRVTDGELGYLLNRARLAVWRREAADVEALLDIASSLGHAGELPGALLALVARGAGSGWAPDLGALQHYRDGCARSQAYIDQAQADACALAGDVPGALAALERADGWELGDRMWIERCPLFDGLRAEPRFQAVAARVVQRGEAVLAAYADGGAP